MTLALLKVDFRQLALSELELFELHQDAIRASLNTPGPLAGFVLLATCNRFELYFETPDVAGAVSYIHSELALLLGISGKHLDENLELLTNSEVAGHLFSVASGLQSMIVGEAEIAGQVKKALRDAQEAKTTTSELEVLFQTAARVSKLVATETELGKAGRSLIHSALDQASQYLDIEQTNALIIGTGAYARVVTAALKKTSISRIAVYSRSGRAKQFASSHALVPVEQPDFLKALASSQLVISASGSQGFALTAEHLARIATKPRVIIDLALSKDVAPEVSDDPDIASFSLKDLEDTTALNQDVVAVANAIIASEIESYRLSIIDKQADPLISALREHIDERVLQEVDRVRIKQGEESAQIVSRSLKRVMNQVFHSSHIQAKELTRAGLEEDYKQALKVLFDLEVKSETT